MYMDTPKDVPVEIYGGGGYGMVILGRNLSPPMGGGVRGIPVQRSCLFLIFRSLFSLQIISRSLFWEHSPFTVLSNNYSLFTVLR